MDYSYYLKVLRLKKEHGCKRVRDLVKVDGNIERHFSLYDFSTVFDIVEGHIDESGTIIPTYKVERSVITNFIGCVKIMDLLCDLTYDYPKHYRLDFTIVDGAPLTAMRLLMKYNQEFLTSLLQNKEKRGELIVYLASKYCYADLMYLSLIPGDVEIGIMDNINVYDGKVYAYLSSLSDMFVLKNLDAEVEACTSKREMIKLYKIGKRVLSIDELVALVGKIMAKGIVSCELLFNTTNTTNLDYYIGYRYTNSFHMFGSKIGYINKMHMIQMKARNEGDDLIFDRTTIPDYHQCVALGIKNYYPSKKSIIDANIEYVPSTRSHTRVYLMYRNMKYGPISFLTMRDIWSFYKVSSDIMNIAKRHYIDVNLLGSMEKCNDHVFMEHIVDSVSPKLIEYHLSKCESDNCFFMRTMLGKTKGDRQS